MRTLATLSDEERHVVEEFEYISSPSLLPLAMLGAVLAFNPVVAGQLDGLVASSSLLAAFAPLLPLIVFLCLAMWIDRSVKQRFLPGVERLRAELPTEEQTQIADSTKRGRMGRYGWLGFPLVAAVSLFSDDLSFQVQFALYSLFFAHMSYSMLRRYAPYGRHWRYVALAQVILAAATMLFQDFTTLIQLMSASMGGLVVGSGASGAEHVRLLQRTLG